jgi:hypothetical protein
MKDLAFTVEVQPPEAGGPGDGEIALGMQGMYMGEHRVRLVRAGAGRWRGQGVFVRCPSGRRGWTAEVRVPAAAGGRVAATFAFEVGEP